MRCILCFSAWSVNLRAVAFIRCLPKLGYEVIVPNPHGPKNSILELVLTLLPNIWVALTKRADLAAGFKPHLNVTIPLLICKLRGIPTWIDIDDLDHAYRRGWLSHLIKWMQRPFPRQFDLVSYHNLQLENYLVTEMACDRARLLRIPQGVDTTLFGTEVTTEGISQKRAELGLASKRVAVFTAHLNVACDLEPVLQAWETVVESVSDACLLVVGGGPRLEEFRKQVIARGLQPHVLFTGEIAHADVPACVGIAEMALLFLTERPVNACRCSLKLREYFTAGIKVVCNDFGELKEFAHLTYQVGTSVDEFAAMIIKLFDGHGDHREAVARTYALKLLDWQRIVNSAEQDIIARLALDRYE